MQKRLALVLCAAWGIALCCCSDDEIAAIVDDPAAVQQALQGCTQFGFFSMLRLMDEVDEVVEVIQAGFTQDGITVDPSTDQADPDFTWIVSSDFSSSGSDNTDTRLSGKITFSEDPTDGIAFGSTADMDLVITSLGGPITGSVEALVTTVNEDTITVSGSVAINDSDDGCNITFTIPTSPGLSLSDSGPSMLPQLAVNMLGLLIEGSFDIDVMAGGHSLQGTLSLPPNSQNANVTDATIDEAPINDFSFEVAPDPETLNGLAECLFGSLFVFQTVIQSIGPIAMESESPGTYEEITVTPVSATVFDFTVDTTGGLVGISLEGILSGTVTLPTSETQPASVVWTFAGTGVSFSAASTSPLMVILPDGESSGSVYGGGAINFLEQPVCSGTFDIPSSMPMELLDGELFGDSGRVTFTATLGDDTLSLTIDLAFEGDVLEASLNGIPIPPELITNIF